MEVEAAIKKHLGRTAAYIMMMGYVKNTSLVIMSYHLCRSSLKMWILKPTCWEAAASGPTVW